VKSRISRGSQGLSKGPRDFQSPCENVKLIFRRVLDSIEMSDLTADTIPDPVFQILEQTSSRDDRAPQVSEFFNSHGWNYEPVFIPIYVYGEYENPLDSGAPQGIFGEAFLLHNSEVMKDLTLVCEEDIQTASINAHPQKFQMFSSLQTVAERTRILCQILEHGERNRPPEVRMYRKIRRCDIACWLSH
jgi:hypothetical protein